MDPRLGMMLCREQRTALTTSCRREARLTCTEVGRRLCDACQSEHSARKCARRSTNYCPKFGEVFAWVCLISLVHTTCAAPARRSIRNMDSQFSMDPEWIAPCGHNRVDNTGSTDYAGATDDELFKSIAFQARMAVNEAEDLRDGYVESVFQMEFQKYHKNSKNFRYKWLPSLTEIPKELGESVKNEHLQSIKADVNRALADIYNHLQRVAVGLEQVYFDQNRLDGQFKEFFEKAKNKLNLVLCEFHWAMLERKTQRNPDVTRAAMPNEFRNYADNTSRNQRDWIIYRDYMNAMEYVYEVFNFLRTEHQ